MRSSGKYRHDRPSLLMRFGAFAGLAFMHIPVLIIILYAFTTGTARTSFHRRASRCTGSKSRSRGRTSGSR
jgi:ABC-type spermidine/putrescine transport system permease subunit II